MSQDLRSGSQLGHADLISPFVSPPATILDVIQQRALRSPDRVAYTFLRDDGSRESLTNRELDTRIRQLAAVLVQHASPGDRALLVFPPGLEFIVAFYACLRARVVAVPATYPRGNRVSSRLESIHADCAPRLALTTESTRQMIENTGASQNIDIKWLAIDDSAVLSAERPNHDALSQSGATMPGRDELALLQYTSGSTSEPKGVMISHHNIMHNLMVILTGFGYEWFSQQKVERVGLFWLPAYHDMGLIGTVLTPLFAEYQSVLMSPGAFLKRPLRWLQALSEFRAPLTGAPNFAYELCIEKTTEEQRAALDLSELRLVFCGAEPISHDSIRRFAEAFAVSGFDPRAFYPCYGLAESTLMVTGSLGPQGVQAMAVSRQDLADHRVVIHKNPQNQPDELRLVNCGQTHLGTEIAIVDPIQRTRVPNGEVGEIWIYGDSVAGGYWQRPEESKDVFRSRLRTRTTETGGRDWLRTGDLGFIHEGDLYVTGRLKDLIILHGQNHYPQDIEQTVAEAHESLLPFAGAAFSVTEDGSEQLVIVQEVERRTDPEQLTEIIDAIREAVTGMHEIDPFAIVLIRQASIPRTTSGKVQRGLCRKMFNLASLNVIGRWTNSSRRPKPQEFPSVPRSEGTISEEEVTALAKALEDWILSWVRSRVEIPPVDITRDTPLDEMGLDSISAMEMSGELESGLDVTLTPEMVLTHPTPAALSAELARVACRGN